MGIYPWSQLYFHVPSSLLPHNGLMCTYAELRWLIDHEYRFHQDFVAPEIDLDEVKDNMKFVKGLKYKCVLKYDDPEFMWSIMWQKKVCRVENGYLMLDNHVLCLLPKWLSRLLETHHDLHMSYFCKFDSTLGDEVQITYRYFYQLEAKWYSNVDTMTNSLATFVPKDCIDLISKYLYSYLVEGDIIQNNNITQNEIKLLT
jgi:hypothetical protein